MLPGLNGACVLFFMVWAMVCPEAMEPCSYLPCGRHSAEFGRASCCGSPRAGWAVGRFYPAVDWVSAEVSLWSNLELQLKPLVSLDCEKGHGDSLH